MYKPQFSFTPKMVNTLGAIERLYGQLTTEKLIPSLALKLTEENQVLATHYSTSIEGNPLSPYDVTNIVLGDKVPTNKSEREVKNYFAALNHLFLFVKKHVPITTELTEELHGILMKDLDTDHVGKFRNGPVFVGHKTKEEIVIKHNPPFHRTEEIKNALSELYLWLTEQDEELHPLIKAGIFHHEFAYIHPFFDGNGRIARLLTAYYLLLKQYEVTKYFILDDYYDIDRHQYSDILHTADLPARPAGGPAGKAGRGDKTQWLEYFLEGIGYSLQAALARIKELSGAKLDEVTGEKRVLVTSREEDVLQIVLEKKAVKMTDIQENLSVTRQQAHALLASLVKKGILQKFGKTKTSYYKLASQPKS